MTFNELQKQCGINRFLLATCNGFHFFLFFRVAADEAAADEAAADKAVADKAAVWDQAMNKVHVHLFS